MVAAASENKKEAFASFFFGREDENPQGSIARNSDGRISKEISSKGRWLKAGAYPTSSDKGDVQRRNGMEKYCESCGMPLSKKEDFALGDESSLFCLYCVNADGRVKSCEEIFKGGVAFFMSVIGDDVRLAERVTRKNMSMQSHWQGKDYSILNGEKATDEEFAQVLKKLSS